MPVFLKAGSSVTIAIVGAARRRAVIDNPHAQSRGVGRLTSAAYSLPLLLKSRGHRSADVCRWTSQLADASITSACRYWQEHVNCDYHKAQRACADT